MNSAVRNVIVFAVAAGLVVLFLRNVDLARVGADIMRARVEWLVFAVATTFVNLAIRAYRWQYLLEPLGRPTFGRAFRATAVGFAASAVLPARAGEVIRPYFLARNVRGMSATGAFATIILERLLDVLTVIVLLALYVFVFGRHLEVANASIFAALKWAAATAAAGALAGLTLLFVMAGDPARVAAIIKQLSSMLPESLAGLVVRVAEKFSQGLGAVRSPGRLAVSLALSFPLWLSIAAGIWGVALAFDLAIPFPGTFLIIAFLVLGVAVPTPGAVGGFHAAFRYGATTFFAARNDAAVGAAIVLHLVSVGPSLLLGLVFAAQAGLNLAGMRHLAAEAEQGHTA